MPGKRVMKKVFTFHGSDSSCGCAWLSRRTAEMVAEKRKDLRVLLVHASHSGSAGTCLSGASMESIRPYVCARKALPQGAAERTACRGDLSVISGAGPSAVFGAFCPDMSESFIKRMAAEYDIVICDSGSEIGQGLPLGAMFASDSIYAVFSHSEESFRRFEWLRPLYEKLGLKLNGYVLDRFPADSPYPPEYVSERLGVDIGRVFFIPFAALKKDIETIAEDIIKDAPKAPESLAV